MIPIIIFQVYYSTMNMSTCHFADQETSTRCTVIIITINTNTAPSPEVELRTLRQALCLFHHANNYLDDFKTETEVGPSGIWNLDQRILHISTITITATTPIYHLDLSITLSSNPRSPARVSCDIIVNLDQTRKLRNQKSYFKITDARKEKLPRYFGKQIIISIYSFHLCNNVNFTY